MDTGTIIDIVGAGIGVGLGGYALWQARKYKQAGDKALGDIQGATLKLASTAEDIADHIRYRIVNVGEAIAYAYKMIDEADTYSDMKQRGEPVDIELYYINIVCCFGSVHQANPAVVEHYDRKAKAAGLVPSYKEITRAFPLILQKLAKKCYARIILLDTEELHSKFFETLKMHSPYDSPRACEIIDESAESEKQYRDDFETKSTQYLKSLPFQMLATRITRNGKVERACSLVLAVGTGTIGRALTAPEERSDEVQANGYYTQDPHYAEINLEIAKSMWNDAEKEAA